MGTLTLNEEGDNCIWAMEDYCTKPILVVNEFEDIKGLSQSHRVGTRIFFFWVNILEVQ